MQLSNQQTLPVGQRTAWEALNDIALLQASIPGCESISASGADQYEVVVMAAVGPVKARFKGRLRLADRVAPDSYTMHFEGQGGAAGHAKGSAQVRLEAAGAGQTLLHYSASASVGGKLAQVGSRLVDMAAQQMAQDFFRSFTAALAEREGMAAPAPATGNGLWARLMGWLRRVLGR